MYSPLKNILSAILSLSLLAAAPAIVASAQEPVDIGSRLELFVDNHLIQEMDNVRLQLHRPVQVPRPDSPLPRAHMVSVIKDGDLYRAWYRGGNPDYDGPTFSGHPGETLRYAESQDGHNWYRPNLGLQEIRGNKDNNVVLANMPPFLHNVMVFVDTREGVDPSERYKAVGGHPGSGNKRGTTKEGIGLYGFVSPDGFEWTNIGEIIPYRPEWRHAFDSPNVAFWSEAEQLYVCYFRTWIEPGGPRTISRSTSPDFINWSDPVEMAPNLRGEHFYTSMTHPYVRAPHIYIALPTRFVPLARDSGHEVRPNRTDVLFMTSRPGSIHYDRLFTEAFMRPGLNPDRWGNRDNFVASNVVQTGPAELSIYHRSGDRYVIRTDGFISVHAGSEEGNLTTKPLIYSGNRMEINFSTSAVGFVQVEMIDTNGNVVAKSQPMVGDAIDSPVVWPEGEAISQWSGKSMQIRFNLKEADLYSFRFTD